MVIDVHTHLMYDNIQENKKLLLTAMERYRIDRIYVSTVGRQYPSEEAVAGQNRATAEFIREHPAQVGGYVYVHPGLPNALDTLRRGVEEQGMEGVKLWADRYCDDPCVYPVIEYAVQENIPVLLHTFHKTHEQLPNETVGGNVARLARKYPQAKLIMAHLGGNCYHGIPAVRGLPNVYVDLSGSQFRDDALAYALEYLGAERILFGSDMPFFYLDSLGQVMDMPLGHTERELILSRNAQRLFRCALQAKKDEVIA